jgi:alpha-beta hydrolase superfamily lysophospholipase
MAAAETVASIVPTEGPAPAEVETLSSRDGTRLRACFFPAVGEARARVLVLHGFGEHAARYTRFASLLTPAGYEVVTLDYRGHGHAGGARGHCLSFSEFLDDVDALMTRVAARQGPSRTFLFGHSHGGTVALRWLLDADRATRSLGRPVDAVAVSSPFLAVKMAVPPLKLWAAKAARRISPRIKFPTALPASYVSHDPGVVTAYETDPLVHGIGTPGWFFALRTAQDEIHARAGEIRLPALFLVAGGDLIVDPERSKAVFERLGTEPAQRSLKVYPTLYHEIFNERDPAPVKDLLDWLKTRLA